MREGHLWGKRDVLIPLEAIDKFGSEAVKLWYDKRRIESLPTYPLIRRWDLAVKD